MRLRQILGRQLISWGRTVYGPLPPAKAAAVPKASAPASTSTVVEATDKPLQWQPHQTGNIVVVEPLLMTQYRRQGGDPDEV